jgi:hypothetical protein
MSILYITGLQYELDAFDKKHKQPLPGPLYDWRCRWIKAIEKAKSDASLQSMDLNIR